MDNMDKTSNMRDKREVLVEMLLRITQRPPAVTHKSHWDTHITALNHADPQYSGLITQCSAPWTAAPFPGANGAPERPR